jgi:hypothetical protein
MLVNSLRNAALKSSADFNAVRFFADLDYARHSLARFAASGIPELVSLASRASESLFRTAPQPAAKTVERLTPSAGAAQSHRLTESQRFVAAKELMNGLVVDAAGFRSVLFVLKLERASTCADLANLIPKFQDVLARSVGQVAAVAMTNQVRALL